MKLIHSHSTSGIFNNSGFTLVELMVALAISGIVMAAVSTAYIAQQRSSTAQEQVAEVQQNIRAGLDIMEREIRMAGFDPLHTAGAGITTANANNLIFTMVADTDGNGTIDEADGLETITYRLYDAFSDGDTDIGREEVPAAIQAVAENIDAIEFLYTIADVALPTTTPTNAQLADIRAIQISILARAGRNDPAFNNTVTYTPASTNPAWDINGDTAGTDNPPNDNFRRRLLITTIQCRNMGI